MNSNMELSLTPEEELPPPLSITPESTTVLPSTPVLQKRAGKYSFASDANYQDTLSKLSLGGEDLMRKQQSSLEDLDFYKKRDGFVRDIIGRQGKKLSPLEYDTLMSMSKEEYASDPQTVFERKVAEKTVNKAVVDNASTDSEGLWGKAFKENPAATIQNMKIYSEQMAKSQYIDKTVDDLTEEGKKLGYLSSIWNFAKSVTPGLSWYNQTRILAEAPWNYLRLPGNTKREQVGYILSLPLEQAKVAIDTSIQTLKGINFNDAQAFAEALKSYTSNQQLLDSGTGVIDLTSLPYKTAGKILFGTGRKVSKLFEGTSKATELAVSDPLKLPPIKEVQQEIFRKNAEAFPAREHPVQLDLFEGDPRQGNLFPFPRSTQPEATSGLPPGKLRSTFKPLDEQAAESEHRAALTGRELVVKKDGETGLGKFTPGQGRYNQLELPLQGGVGQRSFDFTPPSPPRTPPGGDGGLGVTPPGIRPPSGGGTTARSDQAISMNEITKAADELIPGGGAKVPTIGNFVSEALYGAMERLQKAKEGTMRLADGLPSYVDPGNYFGNSRALTNAFANDAIKRAQERRTIFENTLDQSQRVNRVPGEVEAQAFEERKRTLLNREGYKFNDGIIDVVHLPANMFKSNVGQAVLRVGRADKTVFTSRDAAELYAKDMYKLADDEYRIYMDKSNYYIGVPASIAENSDKTLDVFAKLKNVAETSIFSLLSKVRVVDDYVSAEHAGMRKVAAHAQQGLRDNARTTAETFAALGYKNAKQVEAVINDFGNQRKWYNTSKEFEEAFFQRHKAIASPEQIEAAFVYKQMQDHDFMIRNLGVYRDMARQGAEQFSVLTSKGNIPHFNGIQHDNLPWGRSEDFTFAVVKADAEPVVAWGHQADRLQGRVSKDEVNDLLKEGYKVIQTFPPTAKPLTSVFPEITTPVNYIITKNYEVKPLSWHQLQYEPGPHSIYPYEHYIKQAQIAVGHLGKSFYYGDNTLWNFSSEAEAMRWLKPLNEARVMFNNKDPALDAFLAKNLPFTKEQFQSFKNQFDFEVPFSYTKAGNSVFESQRDLEKLFPETINFHKSSHNPANFMDRSFTQERNQLLMNPREEQGVMSLEPSKQLDAFAALQSGLNQSIRGMWMNDYKIGATTQWIENFADMMDVDLKALRATPLFYLYEPKWKNIAKTDTLYPKYVAAEAERQAIVNFIGQSSEIGTSVTVLQNKLMNTIYDRMGTGTANYFAEFHLGFIKDPVPFFRGLAAHPKIGMFNPISGVQQAMVMGNVAAITNPKFAVSSTAAAFLMNGLTHTAEEAIFNSAAKKMASFGWTEAHAKEMLYAYRETGLNTIGAEAAFRADNFDNRLFKGTIGTWMDKGFMFFNAGERLGRKAAFAAAYQEWRLAEPTAKLTDEAMAGLVHRADTMTGNMTSASLANIQNGVLSIPLQFTTYFKHMAELMLGDRLTMAEKARLFTMNSMLYGIPVAAGVGGLPGAIGGAISGGLKDGIGGAIEHGAAAAVGMWPIYDDIKEEAIRRGWDVSPLYWKVLHEGIIGTMTKIITDKDIEFGKTYGAGGSSMIRDIVRQDKGFIETLFGASGSVIGDISQASYPLWAKLADTFRDDGPSSGIQTSDLMKLARNIGVVDVATRTAMAFKYGKFITKQGVEVSDLDSMDSLLVALRLNPKQVQDVYYKRNINQDEKKAQDKFESLAVESLRRANQFARDNDWSKYDELLKDAKAYMQWGDFGPTDRTRIFQRAVTESRGIEANTNKQFFRKAPESLRINRYEDYFTNKGNK